MIGLHRDLFEAVLLLVLLLSSSIEKEGGKDGKRFSD